MKQRDFVRLPLGKFKLTDGIYDYNLRKSLSNDGHACYRIKDELTGEHLFMIENIEKPDEGDCYERIIISILISAGGITIHSKDTFFIFYRLKLLPRGSFAKFIKRTKSKS